MLLLIAPEGTRSGPVEWKRGFWHIAKGAGVPVLPAAIHYGRKVVIFGTPWHPGESFDSDFSALLDFYAPISQGRHPERTSKPLCERQGRTWQPPPSA
jgi:1-acyl-sn-glycerol-3-phosphate acyltransferase